MLVDLTLLDPQELVILLVAVGGLVPLAIYYRVLPRLIVLPYAFLVIGAVMTNAERLFFPDLLNAIEHSVGNLGAGIAFAVLAYAYRRRLEEPTTTTDTPEES